MHLPCRASADTGAKLPTGAGRQRYSALATRRRVARPPPTTPQRTQEPRAPSQERNRQPGEATVEEPFISVVSLQDLKPAEPDRGPVVVRAKAVNPDRGLAQQQGIGSYAAKLQKAQRQGRSSIPSEVNPLHPLTAAERLAQGLPKDVSGSGQRGRAGPAVSEDSDGVLTDDLGLLEDQSIEDFEEDEEDPWSLASGLEQELASRDDPFAGTGFQPQTMQQPASTSDAPATPPESSFNFGLPRGGLKDWRAMSRPSKLVDAPEGGLSQQGMGSTGNAEMDAKVEPALASAQGSAGQRRSLQDIIDQRKARAAPGSGVDENSGQDHSGQDQEKQGEVGVASQGEAEAVAGRSEPERVVPKVTSWRSRRFSNGIHQYPGSPSPSSVADEASSSGSSLKERLSRLNGAGTESAEPTFGQSFYKAAAALQARLTVGVKAEMQEAINAQERVYRRRSIKQLRDAGVVITNLVGEQVGMVFSDFIWRFTLAPEAPPPSMPEEHPLAAVQPAGETAAQLQDTAAPYVPVPRDLPEHAFKKGESVVLLSQRRTRPSKFDEENEEETPQGHILEVRRNYIRVAVSREVSERLLDAGAEAEWRMDKILQETTAERQIQAISMLDKPYAHLEKLSQFEAEISNMDRELPTEIELRKDEHDMTLRREEAERKRGIISKEFRAGELHVRQILLGDPNSATVAAVPPTWASSKEWRSNAKEWLTELGVKAEGYKLNSSQLTAIAKSLSSTLSLWQGPPGTGKTRTLLVLLHVLCKLSEAAADSSNPMGPILACADTNAATDNILEGLLERGVDVVRIGRPIKVRAELRSATLENRALNTPHGQKALEMQREADKVYEERRAGGGLDKAVVSREVWDKRQRYLLKTAKELEDAARAYTRRAQQLVLEKCQIVTATCAGAGDVTTLQDMRFRVVVLDEATQATEPSTLIPLLRGAESVVMAGDPKQLPPTVISERGLQCDLDVTLFERLQVTGVKPYLLDTQYRMHPGIANFPNDLFYAGKLKSGITAADRPAPKGFPWPNPDCPVALIECNDSHESRANTVKGGQVVLTDQTTLAAGSSYCNLAEARLAVRAFEMLMAADDAQSGAILTPYTGQVKVIRNLLKESGKGDKVTVSSVDGYQGREADIIVFSAVRNNDEGRLGFVTDPRRLNVAITRPRRGLVVVGSPYTLSADHRWVKWLTWVRDRGGFLAPEALLLTPEEKLAGAFDPEVVVADQQKAGAMVASADDDLEDNVLIGDDGYMAELSLEEGLPGGTNPSQGWGGNGMFDDNKSSSVGEGAAGWDDLADTNWGSDWYG